MQHCCACSFSWGSSTHLVDVIAFQKSDVHFSIQNNLKKWGNFLIFCDKQLKLTKNGFLYADAIAVDLMI